MRLWIKEVRGLENVPARGAVVVFNHHSLLDPILLSAVLPRLVCFMSVEDDYKNTLLFRCFFNGDCANTMERLLQENKFCCVFPSSLVAYRDVARAALVAKAPFLPIGIIGAVDLWHEHKLLPRFHKSVSITIGSTLSLEKYYGQEEDDEVLEKIGDMAWKATGKLCQEHYSAAGFYKNPLFDPNRSIYPL